MLFLMVDEGTRYKWIHLMHDKAEATEFEALIMMIRKFNTQFERKIKIILTDDYILKIKRLCEIGMQQEL